MAAPNGQELAAERIVARATQLSRFARRLLDAEPQLLSPASVHTRFDAAEMRANLTASNVADEAGLGRALRELRKRVMLRVIARDLGGLGDLAEVVATVSALADIAIESAVEHLERWLAIEIGTPTGSDSGHAQKLHVVGMGKLGGRELNVSSDIDLVFVYPEEGETAGGARALS